MAENLTQYFVTLSGCGSASKAFAKLGFNHAENSLDVAALVIVTHESLTVIVVEVKHSLPQSTIALVSWVSVRPKSDIRDSTLGLHNVKIAR